MSNKPFKFQIGDLVKIISCDRNYEYLDKEFIINNLWVGVASNKNIYSSIKPGTVNIRSIWFYEDQLVLVTPRNIDHVINTKIKYLWDKFQSREKLV